MCATACGFVMAGTKSDVVSLPGVGSADQARGKQPKPARKKGNKMKKSRDGESAVLAHAVDGAAQPPPVELKPGNKDEAAQIRQRLGIKSEDAKSCQTRVGFQFGFSVADSPDTEGDAAADANVQTDPVISGRPTTPRAGIVEDEKTELASTAGGSANKAQSKPVMQAGEAGFIPQRVYIGGMPFWYTEDEIRQCWNECGEISDLTMLTFPDTGNFRGIVFITFATQEGFDAALQFDGDELDGKRLVVQRCKAPAPASHDRKPRQHQGRQHDAGTDAHHGEASGAFGHDTAHVSGQKRGRSGPAAGRQDANCAPAEDSNGGTMHIPERVYCVCGICIRHSANLHGLIAARATVSEGQWLMLNFTRTPQPALRVTC